MFILCQKIETNCFIICRNKILVEVSMVVNGVDGRNVAFSGKIDRSLYKYVRTLQKEEQNYAKQTVKDKPQEAYKEIAQRTNDFLENLKQKVQSMNDGTHLAVKHNNADNSDYLVVFSDNAKKPQNPVSRRLLWFQNTPCAWKLNNLGMGQKMGLGLNQWTAKEPLEILERRIGDIDVVQTDKQLLKAAEKSKNSISLIG